MLFSPSDGNRGNRMALRGACAGDSLVKRGAVGWRRLDTAVGLEGGVGMLSGWIGLGVRYRHGFELSGLRWVILPCMLVI
jgi:hypothetical protein